MKKMILCAAALVLGTPAFGQSAKVFDFMGFDTETPTENPTMEGKACSISSEIAGKATCSSYGGLNLGDAKTSFVVIDLYDGKISSIIGSAKKYEFPALLEVFTAKYGSPKIEKTEWRNAAGAVIPNQKATWTFKHGTLELSAIGSRIGDTDFIFLNMANQPPEKKADVNF